MIYGPKETAQASRIGEALSYRGITLSTVESCTGGGLSACLVSVPGSSSWFKGAAVAYTDEVKENLLGVPHEVLKKYGAVSAECVRHLAEGARKLLNTDMAVSISGVAGPSGDGSKNPIGTVYVAVAIPSRTVTKKFSFKGGREEVRMASVIAALDMIWEIII